ncbi:MAG: putative quinol monooxygenase [Pseudomonadales bacterium]
MSESLFVFATIEAVEGQVEALLQELLQIVEPTRAEEGCRQYFVHHDIDNTNRIHVFEEWRSKADMKQHMKTDHFRQFSRLTTSLVSKVSAKRMERKYQ